MVNGRKLWCAISEEEVKSSMISDGYGRCADVLSLSGAHRKDRLYFASYAGMRR